MSWVWGWMRQPRDVQQMAECLCFVNTVFIQLITTENAVSSSSTKRLCVHRVPSVRVSLFTSFFSGVAGPDILDHLLVARWGALATRKHGEKKETLGDKEANRLRLLQWKISPSLSRALTMYSNTSSYPDAMAGGNSSFGQLEVS
jgi:hypothetical protein